jgi:diguanylate cyclase (GGDEF)-like protein
VGGPPGIAFRTAPAKSVKRTAAAAIFLSLQEPVVLDFSRSNAGRGEAPELLIGSLMRVAMQRKSVVRQRPTEDLNAQVMRLARENAALRREVSKLQVFRALAYRDPLTGLWNRRYFEERLAEEESRSQRAGSGRHFSVLVVDINDFKTINDQHGHPMGDDLLKWAGGFLHTHLRTHDVACRTGGDEFSVLLPDVSNADAARLVARLREQLGVANRGREIPLGISLGTATWPDAGATSAELIAHADEEMYADKRRQKAAAAAVSKPAATALAPSRARTVKGARAKVPAKDAPPAPLRATLPVA